MDERRMPVLSASTAATLRIQAEAIGAVQEALLALTCQLWVAARKAERDELDAQEARELLRQARRWLGESVEIAA